MFPEELESSYKQPKKTLPRPFNHWSDWAESAKANKPAGAGFSYGGPMSETALIGNIDATGTLLEKKSLHLKTTEACGGTAGKSPNNVFGYGLLNIAAAVKAK